MLVKIKQTGQIGFIVGTFMQPVQKQIPATMSGDKVVPGQVVQGLILMGVVAVGPEFICAPLGDIEPIYELPEDGEEVTVEEDDPFNQRRAVDSGKHRPLMASPEAETGGPLREAEGEEK